MAVAVAESLTKCYGSLTAVDGLSFALDAGTVTGFLGPNGAGKTTTLRMLLGLARPTSGRALVFDRPYVELERPALRVELDELQHPVHARVRDAGRVRERAQVVPAGAARVEVGRLEHGAGRRSRCQHRVPT
jgi:ABC-2 type transport system ATP-binding protein